MEQRRERDARKRTTTRARANDDIVVLGRGCGLGSEASQDEKTSVDDCLHHENENG